MNKENFEPLMVWADEESIPSEQVKLLSWSDNSIPVDTYLQVTDDSQGITWILVIKEPNRNIPLGGLDRKDPRMAEASRRVSKGQLTKNFLGNTAQVYVAEPLGMIVEGKASPVTMRPKDGLMATLAEIEDVRIALQLPRYNDLNQIGVVAGTDIPICLNKRAIDHNIIDAGTIGSGKTEVTGRAISVARQMGYCVFVFDHKPDFQDLDKPNDFGEDVFGIPKKDINYWTLGIPDSYEKAISIPFSAVDLEFMLVTKFFPNESDQLGRDVFGKLIREFAQRQNGKENWAFADFMKWFDTITETTKGGEPKLNAEGEKIFNGTGCHSKTLATAYKLSSRMPMWVDRERNSSNSLIDLGGTTQGDFLKDQNCFSAGKVNVINLTDCSFVEYAFFAVTLLKAQLKGRANGFIEPWIFNVIDEAQDIFNGNSELKKIAVPAFAEITRKGRSKHVASWFCVQAFTEIPDQIVQYCNSRIIMKHGSKEIARQALDGDSFSAMQTTTFTPGDAFVRIYGSPSHIRARMLPSPFLITKGQLPEDYAL